MRTLRWLTDAALLALLLAPAHALAADDDDKPKFDDLPKAVKRAVKEKYPEAKVRGVSKEKNDEGEVVFEVELTIDGKSVDLIIDDEGEIETTEKEIDIEDLPRAVIKAARTRFPNAKIVKVEEVSDEDDMVVYEVAFASKDKSFEVVMSPNGKILEGEDDDKATKKDKDDDDKATKKDKDDDDKKEKDDDR